jgi:SAM-dependent methyltransferase
MPINKVIIDKTNKTVLKIIDRNHPKNIKIERHFKDNYNFKDPLIDFEVSIMEELSTYNISPKVIKVTKQGILMTYEGESIQDKPPSWWPSHGETIPSEVFSNKVGQVKNILGILKKHSIKHNDLYQENILIDKDGQIKIIDFTFANTSSVVGPEKYFSDLAMQNDFIFCAKLTDKTLYHAVSPINWSKMKKTLLADIYSAIPKNHGEPGAHIVDNYIYHGLPFNDLEINSHRAYSDIRVKKILAELPSSEIKGLDLGCSVGALSFDLQLSGKQMTGVDYDSQSINFAKKIEEYKQYGVIFLNTKIDKNFVNSLDKTDFVVWLSNWMWIAKNQGFDEAKKLLYEVSKRTNYLFFDTAQGGTDTIDSFHMDGSEGVYELLKQNTVFSVIKDLGESEEGYHKRNLFLCHS